VGNVVMIASRSEAARAAVRADESNLPHARLGGRRPAAGGRGRAAARAIRRKRGGYPQSPTIGNSRRTPFTMSASGYLFFNNFLEFSNIVKEKVQVSAISGKNGL
jgi:hypothetical protein